MTDRTRLLTGLSAWLLAIAAVLLLGNWYASWYWAGGPATLCLIAGLLAGGGALATVRQT